jgi:hypothetical protein
LSTISLVLTALSLALALRVTAADPVDWKRREYGGISAELPGQLRPRPISIPEELKTEFSEKEYFALILPEVSVTVAHSIYTRADVNLDDIAKAAADAVKNQPGNSNVTSGITIVTLDGVSGRKADIGFQTPRHHIKTLAYFAAKDRELWVITIGGLPTTVDETGKRIIASMKWVK